MAESQGKGALVKKNELKKTGKKKLPPAPPLCYNPHSQPRKHTLWSYYFEGNVTIPEICVDSINQQCPKEKLGCSRLHAKQPWHWQLMHAKQWYNFICTQSDILEKAFQKVDKVEVVIPPLIPSKTGKIGQSLHKLLGTDSWKADFHCMKMTRVGFDDSIQIRRLATPSSVKFKHKCSTEYFWYFLRDQHWINFDNCSRRIEEQATSNLTLPDSSSNDIENKYQKNQGGSMKIYVLDDECEINFQNMKLMNKHTGEVMPVRRRPKICNLMNPSIWSSLINDADIAESYMGTVDDNNSYENYHGRVNPNDFYQWQVLHKEIWYNIPKLQANTLERAYLDVWMDGIDIPALQPENMGNIGAVMSTVLGTKKWHAHFDRKTLTKMNRQGKELKIRRLSKPSAIAMDNKNFADFVWFYENKDNIWVECGCIDIMGESNMELPQTLSCDIEKVYISEKLDTMPVTVLDTVYQLNFSHLTLSNSDTNEHLAIRRRPQYARSNSIISRALSMVILSTTSREYDEVKTYLTSSIEDSKIMNIKRIQNPVLRKVFWKRQNEISKHGDSDGTLNILTLFHWVKKGNVEDIHMRNFGQRHLCPDIKKLCDKGEVCFFKSAEFLHKLCSSPSTVNHRLMVFEVIVGKVKEPHSKESGKDYNTKVDDITIPTKFFKTDKRDYCPSYVIEF